MKKEEKNFITNKKDNFDISDSELIEEDYSIYDSIFEVKFKDFEKEEYLREEKQFINKNRNRNNTNNQPEKNAYIHSDEEYIKFINENNIQFSKIKVESIENFEKNIKAKWKIFEIIFKNE